MGIFSNIASVMSEAGNLVKKSMNSFCALETSDGNDLIAKDGSLATVIRIDGIRRMMGDEELDALVLRAKSDLSSYFSTQGHALQVWFSRDPDLSKTMIEQMMVVPHTVAKRLDSNLDDVFQDKLNHLPKFIVNESFYMVLWTRLSVLNRAEINKAKMEMKAPKIWPKAVDSPNPFLAARSMTARHQSFVNSFLGDINNFGLRAKRLNGAEALKAIRESIYPETTGSDWKPYLPGMVGKTMNGKEDRIPWPRMPEGASGDLSHLFWPKIDEQLFTKEAEKVNQHVVRIGKHNFSGTDMSMGPQDLLDFTRLLQRMTEMDEIPWRVSFLIEGDGLSGIGMKEFIAGVASFSNSENRLIRDAVKALKLHKAGGDVVVKMRTSFATWAPSDNLALIEDRANRLQRAVESWGYCQVAPSAGDPLAGVMSSALGLSMQSTAQAGILPLEDLIFMMPWMRDASPFEEGSVLFRTPDGRAWPFELGSDQQDTFIDIIYAPPGKGKSVFLNTTNLAFCLSPGATSGLGGSQLPRVAIIDIGPSSSGLISLLKESLPPDRRGEAEYFRLRMIKDHAINPFDTQLCCRKPLPHERAFLQNFVALLGTSAGESNPPEGLTDLAGMVIDELYEKFSDRSRRGNPRPYNPGEELQVDQALEKWNIDLSAEPTWWECVDKLFAVGAHRDALIAQRQAVPRVEDLMTLRTPQIQDIYGSAKTATSESLLDVFRRVISASIREYPILAVPTRFDIGDARVVSLDLDEAAPRGIGPAEKQTAVVYMLARFVLARDFYLNEENITDIPEEARRYHAARIRRMKETPKRIVYDEFHRTRTTKIIRDQVRIDMREGRKWGVLVALASQLLSDFDEDMLSLATGYWIMGVNTDRDAEEAAKVFGLSDTAKKAVQYKLTGPGPRGAPFLAVLQMKDGKHEHLLMNTLAPTEVWAFSTTAEDVGIRKRLYEALGPVEARRKLSKRFPNGTAKSEVARRVLERAKRGETSDEAKDGVIEEISKELIEL